MAVIKASMCLQNFDQASTFEKTKSDWRSFQKHTLEQENIITRLWPFTSTCFADKHTGTVKYLHTE